MGASVAATRCILDAVLRPEDSTSIATAFRLGGSPALTGPVARGEEGQVWRLETDAGRWAVKETFDPLSPADVDEIAAFQEAASGAGAMTPRVVRTPAGDAAYTIAGTQVRLYQWVDLLPPSRAVDAAAVGRLLAAIHRIDFAGTSPAHPWYSEPIGAGRWRELTDALVAADGPSAEGMASLCDELIALEALLEPPHDLATCHRDLWADNLLATPTGGLYVIDWDNAGVAGLSQEVALVLCEFTAGQPSRTLDLYDAYLGAGGPGRITGTGDFSQVIAQIGHIGESAIATWLDPATPAPERERQVARIDEFVTVAFTRDTIRGILATVT